LQFSDQPSGKDLWWFVNNDDQCELCLKDPGFETTLYLACTLPDMIRIIRGDLPLTRALATERLEAIGSASARKRLAAWLNLSPLSLIGSERPEAAAL